MAAGAARLMPSRTLMNLATKVVFVAALLVSFSGWISPPIALTIGILFGLGVAHPFPAATRSAARILLQVCVVALGFGMNLHEVVKAGRSGFVYTAAGIAFAMIAGLTLGKVLRVQGNSSYLITAGTAICGGSAIAAIGPIVGAEDEELAVSLGTVFILNSVALLIFPGIGGALHLTQGQFGLWAALAIHDTSSVVGAASKYGQEALVIGTTVKLARALWIVPLAFATAALRMDKHQSAGISEEGGSRATPKVQIPWFILFFCLAAVLNTYIHGLGRVSGSLFSAGRIGLTATLFLIGTGISRSVLREVGWRPMLQGVFLWAVVAITSLYLIRTGWIAF